MEARFVALLNAHSDDVDDYLRYTVSLLKANEQPLDWFQLFKDLLQWNHPDRFVQLQWARDFYKTSARRPPPRPTRTKANNQNKSRAP